MHADTAVEMNPVIIVIEHSCDNGQWRVRYVSFFRIFMAKVTSSHEIESEIGYTIDLGSFLISWVTAGQEIESEIQKCNKEKRRKKMEPNLDFDLVTRRDLAH